MFHPLLPDPSLFKDQEIDNKIMELGKKYGIAARLGQGLVCQQLSLILDSFKEEQRKRQQIAMQETIKKQNGDLDDLINID
jgi:hypothetical protein